MKDLTRIMKEAQRMASLWHMDAYASRVVNHAHRLGIVYRASVTQVQWTERGAELARKYA